MTAEANAASVALFRGDEVLLIRRAFAPYRHLWTLPGGRREAGETAEECACREVREELGLTVSALRQVETQALSSAGGDWLLAVFATRNFEGSMVPSAEIAGHRWVRLEALGEVRTTARLAQLLEKALSRLDAG